MTNIYWGNCSKEAEKGNGDLKNEKLDNGVDSVEQESNHLYFYSYVSTKPVLSTVKALNDLARNSKINAVKFGREKPDPVYLHINSCGGVIFDGLAIMDTILNIKKEVPVYTVVEGVCASAATFFAVVGTKRFIGQNSYYLIHQVSHIFIGSYGEFQDEQANLDEFMVKIKNIYAKYTKVPEKELDGILKHDLYWNAQKCLEYKIIDEIL